MKLVLPKEHGTWMMFLLPYVLGMAFSGPKWIHLPLFIGWFFIYLSMTPWLAQLRNSSLVREMRPWALSYTAIGLAFALPVVAFFPELLWLTVVALPCFAVNLTFLRKKNERHMLNDICGVAIFSLGSVAAYTVGRGALTGQAWQLFAIVTLYFVGTSFYVKSLIRERKNDTFRKKSHIFHAVLLALPLLTGYGTVAWAYLPGTVKDWFTPRGKRLAPLKIGLIEIANGIVFFILLFGLTSLS